MRKLLTITILLSAWGTLLAQRPTGSFLGLYHDGDYGEISGSSGLRSPELTPTTNKLTIEAWVKPLIEPDGQVIISKYNSSTQGDNGLSWILSTQPGSKIRFGVYYGQCCVPIKFRVVDTDDGVLKVGEWQHVAGTFDIDTQELHVYVDGTEAQSSLVEGSVELSSILFSDTPVRIGTAIYSDGNFVPSWIGGIDEVRIWNVPRSQAQIRTTMNDTLNAKYYATPDSGLVAYWRFEKLENLGVNGNGGDVRDLTTYENHCDLIGHALLDVGLTGVTSSSAAWGDYDNDGDLDILIVGDESLNVRQSKIYRNDAGIFTEIDARLPGIRNGSVAWGDYDNDSDLDILLTGNGGGVGLITRIYRNDDGVFHDVEVSLVGVNQGSAVWGDYDNDGDLDIVLTGSRTIAIGGQVSIIYRNDGGVFTDIQAGLAWVSDGAVAWGDYDNDSDLDILLTGKDTSDVFMSRIYHNDDGVFADIKADLTGVTESWAAWGDYDNDGDLDIALTGGGRTELVSKIYRNDDGIFSDIEANLTGAYQGSVAFGDYDNDGDLDIVLVGRTGPDDEDIGSEIYRNNNGNYSNLPSSLIPVRFGPVVWGDYDNDGDLDILLSGLDPHSRAVAHLYQNDALKSNSIPSAPTNLSASLHSDTALLNWEAAIDTETPSPGLTYNLRIGTTPGGSEIVSPMAGASGYRRVAQLGNVNHNLGWTIRNLQPNTTYYWSVQAIDNSFAGGPFAPEQSFTTGAITSVDNESVPIPTAFSLSQNYPNPFNPETMIQFDLATASRVQLDIFNLMGQKVVTLVDERQAAGSYSVTWDGRDKVGRSVASGVYMYRLSAGKFVATRKLTLLR